MTYATAAKRMDDSAGFRIVYVSALAAGSGAISAVAEWALPAVAFPLGNVQAGITVLMPTHEVQNS